MTFRLGCCGCMTAGGEDGTGIHVLETAAALGFDYVELSLAHLMRLDDAAFGRLRARLDAAPIGCEVCHNFFPPTLRITGAEADAERAAAYGRAAIARAAALGAKAIVFGSSGAKNVPAGFPIGRAWEQIVALLRALDPHAGHAGLTIVIEPLNRVESNIVNSVAEGLRLARAVAGGNVRLLADYYHIAVEGETLATLAEAGPVLRHVHFAEREGRSYPRQGNADYSRFFRALRAAGYDGRVSVEAFSADFAADAARAVAVLRPILAEVGV